jgi:hypothetical protein
MDDLSLEVIEEPPLKISTPLEEYYLGEPIPWTVNSVGSAGPIKVALLEGDRLVREVACEAENAYRGGFISRGLKPGIFTLRAVASRTQPPITHSRQLILSPDPFAWEESK